MKNSQKEPSESYINFLRTLGYKLMDFEFDIKPENGQESLSNIMKGKSDKELVKLFQTHFSSIEEI